MSIESELNTVIKYLSGFALALFFLVYLPWTALSAYWVAMQTISPALLWVYYFTLLLGLLSPIFYSIDETNIARYSLGLAIALNSVLWVLVDSIQTPAAATTFLVGALLFLEPVLKRLLKNWSLVKNIVRMLEGALIVVAVAFYSGGSLANFIGYTSYNHVMPQFIFIGGGLTVVFAVVLFIYSLLNLLASKMTGHIGDFINKIVYVFYLLLVLVFLLGVTYNLVGYVPYASSNDPWNGVPFPTSIEFFRGLFLLGASNLGTVLLIVLYIYGMNKIAERRKSLPH